MPRKKPDLKQRLNEVREEPAPPVDLTIEHDAESYQALKTLARRHRQPVKAYLVKVLRDHAEDPTEQS